jgi:hypothetical protein
MGSVVIPLEKDSRGYVCMVRLMLTESEGEGEGVASSLFVRLAVNGLMMAFPGLVRSRGEAVCKRVAALNQPCS